MNFHLHIFFQNKLRVNYYEVFNKICFVKCKLDIRMVRNLVGNNHVTSEAEAVGGLRVGIKGFYLEYSFSTFSSRCLKFPSVLVTYLTK